VVSAFVSDGLRRGERVAVYTRGGDGASLLSGLSLGDAPTLVAAGKLVLEAAEDAYAGGGRFDGAQRAEQFAEFAAATEREGYAGLRVFADNGWLIGPVVDPDEWLEYELRVALLIPQHRLTGLCGFDASPVGPLPTHILDCVHAATLEPGATPDGPWRMSVEAPWRLSGDGRTLGLSGELDGFGVDDLVRVLDAARPLLADNALSLAGVRFADGAAADALRRFLRDAGCTAPDVPSALTRIWHLLDQMGSG
jgi:hypothetical protein